MKIFSAGPTTIAEDVRKTLAGDYSNADLEDAYYDLHFGVEDRLCEKTNAEACYLFLAEAMAALESSIISFVNPKDRVLVLSNGFFGEGFKDLVAMRQAEAVVASFDDKKSIDPKELKEYLEKDHNFQVATLVHCETPTGVLNDIHEICSLLSSYGIFTIVDSVSALGAHEINMKKDGIDCLLGGSQKVFSVPSGISILCLSKKAVEHLQKRKECRSYYLDLKNYMNERKERYFPYTMNDGLTRALSMTLDRYSYEEHKQMAQKVRNVFKKAGFVNYVEQNFSNTLSCFYMPKGLSGCLLLEKLQDRGFIISGGLGHLQDQVFRIGHMGENLRLEYKDLMRAMDHVFEEMGYPTSLEMYWDEE